MCLDRSYLSCNKTCTLSFKFYHKVLSFNDLYEKAFNGKWLWGKGEIAGNKHFLLCPQILLPYQRHFEFRNVNMFVV